VIRTSESKDRLCRHRYTYTDLVVDRKEKEEEGRKRDVGNRNSRDVVVQQQHAAQGLLVLRHDQRRPGRHDVHPHLLRPTAASSAFKLVNSVESGGGIVLRSLLQCPDDVPVHPDLQRRHAGVRHDRSGRQRAQHARVLVARDAGRLVQRLPADAGDRHCYARLSIPSPVSCTDSSLPAGHVSQRACTASASLPACPSRR